MYMYVYIGTHIHTYIHVYTQRARGRESIQEVEGGRNKRWSKYSEMLIVRNLGKGNMIAL